MKLAFALARGKKQYDKRATIKARDIERDQARDASSIQLMLVGEAGMQQLCCFWRFTSSIWRMIVAKMK